VGGKTQPAAIRELAGRLRLDYAQFLELEVFARFGQVLDPRTERALEHGRRIRGILEQPQAEPYALATEVALLLAVHDGVLDDVPVDRIGTFKAGLEPALRADHSEVARRIDETGMLAADDRERLLGWLRARARGGGG
jgi:F-type H+-transporting ATPase subunit alpha